MSRRLAQAAAPEGCCVSLDTSRALAIVLARAPGSYALQVATL
eukprot:CAMPEP_0194507908 /NCGR_PEP_ID=MMETSP0253-20130528/37636_1 /TAXON_ID=2966 /ORGANISM="Noctiluca scintillans" /LENGTH=42 /DNA_ID= /DNA_START= /DNA_END= /DNA_ORIENTATION=